MFLGEKERRGNKMNITCNVLVGKEVGIVINKIQWKLVVYVKGKKRH